jgi:hypothetical protein
MTKLEELQEIAKTFCKKMGYKYIFANEYKFGFQYKNGSLWTMSYLEMKERLKELEQA